MAPSGWHPPPLSIHVTQSDLEYFVEFPPQKRYASPLQLIVYVPTTCLERGAMREKCLGEESSTMTPARARTWSVGLLDPEPYPVGN